MQSNLAKAQFLHLQLGHQPLWPCPSCNEGRLTLGKDDLRYSESAETLRNKHHDEWHHGDAEFIFSVALKCNNQRCRETVHVVGKGSYEPCESLDEDGVPFQDDELIFCPHFISPPLRLFDEISGTPPAVWEQLKTSFSVFFADASSAGNHLRSAVECWLDKLGISKRQKKKPKAPTSPCRNCGAASASSIPASAKTKYVNLTLHQRIEKMPDRFKEIKDLLLAVKCLGNAGSHLGGLTRKDVLLGYEIMAKCLSKHYDKREEELRRKVKQINRRGGAIPIKRSRLPRGIRRARG